MAGINMRNIEAVIKSALEKSIEAGLNNRLRSAIFVSTIAEGLYSFYEDSNEDLALRVIGFDEDTGARVKGEKMLDISIARTKEITDPGKANSKAIIGYQLMWAVESEAGTGLPDFAEDFGKLACVKSKNYLYLNGLDQLQEESRLSYIDRRLEVAKQLLEDADLEYDNFYYAFWPSPAKNTNHNKSFWDMNKKDDLLGMVRVFEL